MGNKKKDRGFLTNKESITRNGSDSEKSPATTQRWRKEKGRPIDTYGDGQMRKESQEQAPGVCNYHDKSVLGK